MTLTEQLQRAEEHLPKLHELAAKGLQIEDLISAAEDTAAEIRILLTPDTSGIFGGGSAAFDEDAEHAIYGEQDLVRDFGEPVPPLVDDWLRSAWRGSSRAALPTAERLQQEAEINRMSDDTTIAGIQKRLKVIENQIQASGNVGLEYLPDRVIELAGILSALAGYVARLQSSNSRILPNPDITR
jgi:hypothetical protein